MNNEEWVSVEQRMLRNQQYKTDIMSFYPYHSGLPLTYEQLKKASDERLDEERLKSIKTDTPKYLFTKSYWHIVIGGISGIAIGMLISYLIYH